MRARHRLSPPAVPAKNAPQVIIRPLVPSFATFRLGVSKTGSSRGQGPRTAWSAAGPPAGMADGVSGGLRFPVVAGGRRTRAVTQCDLVRGKARARMAQI